MQNHCIGKKKYNKNKSFAMKKSITPTQVTSNLFAY